MTDKKIIDIWGHKTPKHIDDLRIQLFDKIEAWEHYLQRLAIENDYEHMHSVTGGNSARTTYQHRKTLDFIAFGYEFDYEDYNGEINKTPMSTQFVITDRSLLNRYRKTKHAEKIYAVYNQLVDALVEERERREIIEKLNQ